MPKKADHKPVTADAILKAVGQGAKSPTTVAKALGFKSGGSLIIKRLMAAVPDLKSRMAAVPDLKSRLAANQKTADAEAKTEQVAVVDTLGGRGLHECIPHQKAVACYTLR